MGSQKNIRRILIIAGIAWFIVVGVGLAILWNYSLTPGIPGKSPVHWPPGSQIIRAPGGATLIMLAHPRCPCSRASIGELALLMTCCQGKLTAYVLFFKPEGFSDDWVKTDLWHSAAAIPGVDVRWDEGGIEAHRFGAETSGQTLLYDASGHLLFSGGITAARGHFGDNVGRSTIISLLTKGVAHRLRTFVFGCPLFDVSSEAHKEFKVCYK